MVVHLWRPDAPWSPSASEIESLLFRVLEDSDCPVDVALVLGAALARIPAKEEKEVRARHGELLLLAEERRGGLVSVCIAEGILNTLVGGRPPEDRDCGALLPRLWELVLVSCSASSPYTFQQFQCLKLLCGVLRQLVKKEEEEEQISSSPFIRELCRPYSSDSLCGRTFSLLNSSWESPTKGVPDLVGASLAALLEAVASAGHGRFVEDHLFGHTWRRLGWRNKCKYALLEVLLPHLGRLEDVLEANPEIGHNMGQSFASNYVASAGAALYKLMLKRLDFAPWEKHLKASLIGGLLSEDPLVAANACNHWLGPTVSAYRERAVDSLLEHLEEEEEEEADPPAPPERRVTAIMLVLKAGRQSGLEGEREEGRPLGGSRLRSGLRHASPSVRVAAFSALCQARKRASAPTREEVGLAVDFVRANLSVDSPSFRQTFLGDLAVLLVRCRDFLAGELRKGRDLSGDGSHHLLAGLDALLELLFANCFPGANYQRLMASLEALYLFSSCFFHFRPGTGLNKSSGNGDPSALLEHSRSRGMLREETEGHLAVLISCILHHMADVRAAAARLLERFLPPGEAVQRELVSRSLELVCSPKFAETESAAAILRLISRWNGGRNPFPLSDIVVGEENLAASLEDGCDTFSELLLRSYGKLLRKSDDQFLAMAKRCPMHGLLTAVRCCLWEERLGNSGDFPRRAVGLLAESSRVMLGRLSSRDAFADFSDMAEAVEAVCEGEEETVEISDEHQLVLACAWLNLKECCLLSTLLVQTFELSDGGAPGTLSVADVEKCCEVVIDVLARCRHKGAIISAQGSLQNLSARLLSCGKREFRSIPERFLTKILDQLEDTLSGASATRRSAGLPMLVLKIVSGEPRSCRGGLLKLAMARYVRTTFKQIRV